MTHTNTLTDSHLLDVATLLMWMGLDTAADIIYAAVEAEASACDCDSTAGTWADAFAR